MDAYVDLYGARNPQDAAGVFFQKGEVYEAQNRVDDLRAHLRGYLETVGEARRPRPPGAGALPAGRAGLERVVRARVRGRRLPARRSPDPDAQPRGDRSGEPPARAEQAHPVRAGDQVEDRHVRPEPPAGVRRRGALPRRDRPVEGRRFLEPDRRARRRCAPRVGRLRGGGRGLLPGREGLRGSAAREVSPEPRLLRPDARPQPAAAGRGREEAGGFQEALRRLPRREGAPAREDAPALPRGVQAAPGAVDDRGRRARRSAAPGLRRPALHRRDPEGPARNRSVGEPPARSLLRARSRSRPRRSKRRRSRDSAPAWTRRRSSPGSTTGRARASAS